jgi:hypothetical protein
MAGSSAATLPGRPLLDPSELRTALPPQTLSVAFTDSSVGTFPARTRSSASW